MTESFDLLRIELLGIPRDTSIPMMRIYMEGIAKLPPEQCLEQAFDLSEMVEELAAAGVRQRHPEYNEDEVVRAVRRLFVGEEPHRRFFPEDGIQP